MDQINEQEKKFIEANLKLLKALAGNDDVSLKQARQLLQESMQRIMTLPSDHILTRALVRRAKHIAKDTPHKYICPTCHKAFDKREDLLKDMEDHIIDFYAGIPVRLSPEHVRRLKKEIPKYMHHKLNFRVEKDAYKPE